MNDRMYVCESDELLPGERTIVTVNDREVGILNVEGEYRALSNVCPHQRGPVCEGAIKKEISGKFNGTGNLVDEFYTDTTTISCPYHGWEFDIETGEHVGDRRFAVPIYDVTEEDGKIYLEF